MFTHESNEMPLKDRLYMNPIDKFRVYGIFPWAMIIAVLLAICTSLQVILVISSSTNYSYEQMKLWNDLFLNKDLEGQDSVIINSYHIFNLIKLKEFIDETVKRYIHIDRYTLDDYDHFDLHNGEPVVRMYIDYLDRSKAFVIFKKDKDMETKYILKENDLGPFDHYPPKVFLELVSSFMLEFSFKHKFDHNVPTASSCYTWKIYQNYEYSMHGPITVSLDFDRGVCDQGVCNLYSVNFSAKYYSLNLFTLILAVSQIVLTIAQLYRRTALMGSMKNVRASRASAVWDSLDFEEKLKFIDLWIIFTSIGNICQILGCSSILIIGNVALQVNEAVIGLGCFFSWISVIQHLKQYHTTYIVIDTLSRSFNRLGAYICGVLPIFIGFVLLAMCLFWKTGNYSTFTESLIISFGLVNGDSLFQYMSSNMQVSGFLGEIYCYAFLLFFISIVQNIFIAIIVDGFQSLQIDPIDKTGDREGDLAYDPQVNISLQTLSSSDDKTLSRQKSKLAFKKLLDKSSVTGKDKTDKYIDKIDSHYEAIIKSLNKLIEMENLKDKQIDLVKLKEIIRDFLKNEVPDLVETVIGL